MFLFDVIKARPLLRSSTSCNSQEMRKLEMYKETNCVMQRGKAISGGEFFRMRNVTRGSAFSFFGNSAAPLHQKGPKSLNQF